MQQEAISKTQHAKLTIRDLDDRETMFRLWQERGPQTQEQLIRAGISKESQTRNAPAVAERIRLLEPMAA